MNITTLLENDSLDSTLRNAHGLSLYIEYNGFHILFDKGPGNQYLKNANTLGIDISDIDYLVISHGHFDHAKDLKSFLKVNKKAKVIISINAFDKYYKENKKLYLPIGIKKPKNEERLIYIDKDTTIADGFHIICELDFVKQVISDDSLIARTSSGEYIKDPFDHEIYMALEDQGQLVLFSACSHKGIEYIIDSVEQKLQMSCKTVIGGYHFSHYDSSHMKEFMYLEHLGNKWNQKECTFYTGHCTGDEAFMELKQHLSSKLVRIKTGSKISI